MLESQGGVCAICGLLPQGKANGQARPDHLPNLHVDHCHKQGHVRGLLCSNCNTLLGLAKDDPETLLRAIRYLTQT